MCLGAFIALDFTSTALADAPPTEKSVVIAFPLTERVATAPCVVVGKITEIEDKKVAARRSRGAEEKDPFTIAVVEINEGLIGAKGVTHMRVGFLEPKPASAPEEGAPAGWARERYIQQRKVVVLTKGQEGIFMLTPHFEETFYTISRPEYVINKQDNPNYDKERETVRRAAKLLADPDASLRSKDAGDRFLTAAMLVVRYRTITSDNAKEEEIDGAQSKLILLGLAEGDWSKDFSPTDLTPIMVLDRLGLTEKDNWKPSPSQNPAKDFSEHAKKWIKENADTYRIKRFIEKKE
jgi:hypothetical protein